MAELRLTLVGTLDDEDNIICRFGSYSTVGHLVDELERRFDQPGDAPRALQRRTRRRVTLGRETRLAQADLRNGDVVSFVADGGSRPAPASAAVAHLRIVTGADAGRVHELRRGESTIGRSGICDIKIDDDQASRRHAVLRVSDTVEVADAGSTNGVLVDGVEILGTHRLAAGSEIQIGDTILVVELLRGVADHDAVDLVGNAVGFNRPPRLGPPPFTPGKVILPAPPDPPPRTRFPIVSALAPLAMGGVLLAYTGRKESVIFVGLSPMMMAGTVWEARRAARKEQATRQGEFRAILDDRIAALERARDDEVANRRWASPGPDELAECALSLGPRLWERQPDDNDFLSLRVGCQQGRSATEVEIPPGGTRQSRQELEAVAAGLAELPAVPVTLDARAWAPIGVAGPAALADGVARWLVVQAATLHSPDELVIGCLLAPDRQAAWEWLTWLPHNSRPVPGGERSLNAIGSDDGWELLGALQDLVQIRTAPPRAGGGPDAPSPRSTPHILLLVDGALNIERARLNQLLDQGPAAGVSVVWLAGDARRLPNACRSSIVVEPGGSSLTVTGRNPGDRREGVPVEQISPEAAEEIARALAPVVDIGAGGAGEAALPATVSLVELLGGPEVLDNPALTVERWAESRPDGALRAPVGVSAGGVVSIDLREDGPHGLVGGTTGAGKSEFLQSFLAALAATHSPERLNFLLVDYKGGSAFGDLVDRVDADGRLVARGLHHAVGMITDLTPALVQRALASLQAELTRREHILNRHQVKDLAEMARLGLADTPPSLLIVVDEFAALAREAPGFVDGVVDIAARGRSLGLHLLLATQKPGGVVTPAIQANTSLRVALRMASDEESNDVVGSPAAGRLSRRTPGRGVLRRGHVDLVTFQSAYVGGVTTDSASSEASVEVGELSLAGVRWLSPRGRAPAAGPAGGSRPSDLRRLVAAINQAAATGGYGAPRRPWLDPLPATIDLLELPRPTDDRAITYGVADLPRQQSRQLAQLPLDEAGSILVYGMGGSGKTVLLRTLAASAGLVKNRAPVHVYGLDFAGRGLDLLVPLPHVGGVISGDDYERVTRLLRDLQTTIGRRREVFADAQASTMQELRASGVGGSSLPRMLVLLDGYDNFAATYERLDRGHWTDLLPRLVADGRPVGVHFAFTGTRRTSFPLALTSVVPTRVVGRLASSEDYVAVSVNPDWFDASTPAGRARISGTEVQVAILGGSGRTADEAEAYRRLGHALSRVVPLAPEVRVLPDAVTLTELPAAKSGLPWLLSDNFAAVGPALDQHVLIAGRAGSGRTTALTSLVAAARRSGLRPEVFAADPDRCPVATGDLAALAHRLAADATGLLMIDGAERVAGSPAELPLLQALTAGSVTVVATADTTAARSYDPILKPLRARCDVVVLQPDADFDSDLLGQPIPRTARRFGPGRGYARMQGTVDIVQVATAE